MSNISKRTSSLAAARLSITKIITASMLSMAACSIAAGDEPVPAHPYVVLDTSAGSIVLELDGRRAPLTVKNFLKLVDSGYYDGTIFHRVIPDFMIQGGGYTRDLASKEPDGGIPNESGNGLPNLRATIAMARQEEPHSAMAQFYINVADNKSLNPQSDHWGYTVFGYVVEGMDVADKIANVPTGPAGQFGQDVPLSAVVINKAHRRD